LHGSILEKIGADKVFYPEREMGMNLAYVLTLGDIIDYIPLSAGYGVHKLIAPQSFFGQTLMELGFGSKGKWEIAVLLIQRKNQVIITPNDVETVKPDDTLVVAGSWDKLEELFIEAEKNPENTKS
jgi:trk system potassium uptake protein